MTSQNESICRLQNICDRKIEICFGKGRKHCGKRRKCWLPAFSPFPTMFLKGFFFNVVKSRNSIVKSGKELKFVLGWTENIWVKEKMLVTTIFPLSNNDFKCYISRGH